MQYGYTLSKAEVPDIAIKKACEAECLAGIASVEATRKVTGVKTDLALSLVMDNPLFKRVAPNASRTGKAAFSKGGFLHKSLSNILRELLPESVPQSLDKATALAKETEKDVLECLKGIASVEKASVTARTNAETGKISLSIKTVVKSHVTDDEIETVYNRVNEILAGIEETTIISKEIGLSDNSEENTQETEELASEASTA